MEQGILYRLQPLAFRLSPLISFSRHRFSRLLRQNRKNSSDGHFVQHSSYGVSTSTHLRAISEGQALPGRWVFLHWWTWALVAVKALIRRMAC